MKLSKLAIASCLLFFALSYPYELNVKQDKASILTWDVYGYYLYLPAIFCYGDPYEYKFTEEHLENYPGITADLYQLRTIDDKLRSPHFTIGLSLLWLPFFLIAHIYALNMEMYATDGLSQPYQWSIVAASLFYCLIGFIFLRKILLKYFSETVTTLTILAIAIGTNYHYYVTYKVGMTHTYLFSLYAILLYFTIEYHEAPTRKKALWLGFFVGLIGICRPSDIICLLVPLLYGVYSKESYREKLQLVKNNLNHVGYAVIGGFIAGLPQIIYWKWTLNKWFSIGYFDNGNPLTLSDPHIIEGLFSFQKGWLIYTPMMMLAMIGFYFLFKKNRSLFSGIIVFFILNIYLVWSVSNWWYSHSFGQRVIIQSYALLSIPLAYFIERFWSGKVLKKLIISFLLFFFIGLNLFQNWQYRNHILLSNKVNWSYYWKVFGQTERDKDLYKYIYLNQALFFKETYKRIPLLKHEFQLEKEVNQYVIYKNKFAKILKTNNSNTAALTLEVSSENIRQLKSSWIDVRAEVATDGMFDEYKPGQLELYVSRGGTLVKKTFIRFNKYKPRNTWYEVFYEMKLPQKLKEGDLLIFYVKNYSTHKIYVHSMSLSLLK